MIFFSYRDFTAGPDKILEKINFGRAHHRVIYFVGKKNNITIKELLIVLKITKQSLSRVLSQLVKEGFIIKAKDIEKIKNASKKIFPIKFSDVHPLTENLNITKDKINLMEKFWINSGFQASKEKLLSLLS